MVIGRSNIARGLVNLCVEVKPLLKILNECGYDLDEVQDAKIQFSVYKGPIIQLFSHGIWADVELSMKIWGVV